MGKGFEKGKVEGGREVCMRVGCVCVCVRAVWNVRKHSKSIVGHEENCHRRRKLKVNLSFLECIPFLDVGVWKDGGG